MLNQNRDERLLVLEGIFSGILTGLVEVYAAAYCLFLKASPLQIALLASLPLFISSVVQLKAPKILQKMGSRKKLLKLGVFSHALLSFAMAFAYLLPNKVGTNAIILGFCLFSITGQLIHPPWMSWIGDIIPQNGRGKFLGERTRYNHLAIFVATLLGGAFLSWMKKLGLAHLGFCLLYIAGGVFRLLCWLFIDKIKEPALQTVSPENTPTLTTFTKNLFRQSFGLFVVYSGIVSFALFMVHPFIAPYLLEGLKIDYFTYGLLFDTMVIAKIIFYFFFGKWADRYPTKKIFAPTSLLFALAPLLWLFSTHPFYLFFAQAWRGAFWSGFDILSLKFLLDSTQPESRTHLISYYTLFNGIFALVGSVCATGLIYFSSLPSPYFLTFIIGSVIQLLSLTIFFRHD